MNCDCINGKNLTVIELGLRALNVLCQMLKYYIGKVFAVKCLHDHAL